MANVSELHRPISFTIDGSDSALSFLDSRSRID